MYFINSGKISVMVDGMVNTITPNLNSVSASQSMSLPQNTFSSRAPAPSLSLSSCHGLALLVSMQPFFCRFGMSILFDFSSIAMMLLALLCDGLEARTYHP